MPRKIKALIADLKKAGDDAKRYQEKEVAAKIKEAQS